MWHSGTSGQSCSVCSICPVRVSLKKPLPCLGFTRVGVLLTVCVIVSEEKKNHLKCKFWWVQLPAACSTWEQMSDSAPPSGERGNYSHLFFLRSHHSSSQITSDCWWEFRRSCCPHINDASLICCSNVSSGFCFVSSFFLVDQISPISSSHSCLSYWPTPIPSIPWMETQQPCTSTSQKIINTRSKVARQLLFLTSRLSNFFNKMKIEWSM